MIAISCVRMPRMRSAMGRLLALGVLFIGCSHNGDETSGPSSRVGPRLEIGQTSRDVGEADLAVLTEGKYPVQNSGEEALTLQLAMQSCLCTEVVVPSVIAPGGEGVVVMRWTPHPGQVGPQRLSSEIRTNDPARPSVHLEMTGTVNPLFHIWPEDKPMIEFGEFSPAEIKKQELKIFSTKLPAFELEAKITNPGLILSKRPLKLHPDARIGVYRPTCGYSLTIETTPELTTGSFALQVPLTFKPPEGGARTVSLWVSGAVVNRIFTVSPNELVFSNPRLADGDVQKVRIQFIDSQKNQSLKIVTWSPAFLECDAPRPLDAAPGRWEFVVRIPAGKADVAEVQRAGALEGKVVLQASDSAIQYPVRVRWRRP
jgi:hypothetical protein